MNCLNCGKEVKKENRLFCCVKCREAMNYELVKCQGCGQHLERLKGIDERWGEAYCSFDCYAVNTRQVKKRIKCKICGKKNVPLLDVNHSSGKTVRLCPNCYAESKGEKKLHISKLLDDIVSSEDKDNTDNTDGIVVLIDTREQKPWELKDFETKIATLSTGDYQIEGCDNLVIERKGAVAELWGNLLNDKRFFDEMERLKRFDYSYVVCDFTFEEFMKKPWQLSKWATHKMALRKLFECQVKYGVRFVFAGKHAQQAVRSIIKRVIDVR
jgi:hypothetical protein